MWLTTHQTLKCWKDLKLLECVKHPDKVTKLTLKSKDFRYMTEEYKYYKVHKSDKVISYVRL